MYNVLRCKSLTGSLDESFLISLGWVVCFVCPSCTILPFASLLITVTLSCILFLQGYFLIRLWAPWKKESCLTYLCMPRVYHSSWYTVSDYHLFFKKKFIFMTNCMYFTMQISEGSETLPYSPSCSCSHPPFFIPLFFFLIFTMTYFEFTLQSQTLHSFR